MRFPVLATDYDGTIAFDGNVDEKTLAALERVRLSGRKLILVTGRHLPELLSIFSRLQLFDRVVVENGGLLYEPKTHREMLLCEPTNKRLISLLKGRGVPFTAGKTIVATWKPHEEAVQAAVRDSGLDLHVILNKSSVMVLPAGVDKGTGLKVALDELGISLEHVVSVGDAENDTAFLGISGCSVAVANALPSVKGQVDIVLDKPRVAGIIQLVDKLVADDLADFDCKATATIK